MVKEVDVAIISYESFYVKTHEGGRNGDQKDGGGRLCSYTNTN